VTAQNKHANDINIRHGLTWTGDHSKSPRTTVVFIQFLSVAIHDNLNFYVNITTLVYLVYHLFKAVYPSEISGTITNSTWCDTQKTLQWIQTEIKFWSLWEIPSCKILMKHVWTLSSIIIHKRQLDLTSNHLIHVITLRSNYIITPYRVISMTPIAVITFLLARTG
jgi:hypothetical protein